MAWINDGPVSDPFGTWEIKTADGTYRFSITRTKKAILYDASRQHPTEGRFMGASLYPARINPEFDPGKESRRYALNALDLVESEPGIPPRAKANAQIFNEALLDLEFT